MAQAWKCSGLRWADSGPVLAWDGGRRSALTWGKRVAFGVADGGVRTCVGARGHACPVRAVVPRRSTGARCEECARLARAQSVAAGEVTELAAGGGVSGELVAAAGPDLHLATGRGVIVLDTRLMTGWDIVPVGGDEGGFTVPVRAFREAAGVQDGLF